MMAGRPRGHSAVRPPRTTTWLCPLSPPPPPPPRRSVARVWMISGDAHATNTRAALRRLAAWAFLRLLDLPPVNMTGSSIPGPMSSPAAQ